MFKALLEPGIYKTHLIPELFLSLENLNRMLRHTARDRLVWRSLRAVSFTNWTSWYISLNLAQLKDGYLISLPTGAPSLVAPRPGNCVVLLPRALDKNTDDRNSNNNRHHGCVSRRN